MTEREFLEEFSIELEEEKHKFLQRQDCPTLIKGTAGSGKSFLLLNRIAYLLESGECPASQMLNLVHDRALAKEMTKKYRYYFADTSQMPEFTDIYTFAYQIIRRYDRQHGTETRKAFMDMSSIVKKLLKEMFAKELRRKEVYPYVKNISYCRSMMLPEREIQKIELEGIDFFALYREYERFKEKRGIYDFDDLLVHALSLLGKDGKLLEDVRRRCRFLHVDDAQELSFAAHMLLKLACGEAGELFMCADMELDVSAFHTPFKEALEQLESTYPDAQIIEWRKNYRSTQTIVTAANSFYYGGRDEMISLRKPGCELKFKGFSELYKLYDYACRRVMEEEAETLFVYRDFAMAIPLIERLHKEGIPYVLQGNIEHFLQERFVRDMWNFIELLVDPKDIRAFYEVYELLGLELSKRVLLEVSERLQRDEGADVYQALMESSCKAAVKKKLASLMELIRMAENKSTLHMVMFIMEKLGYRAHLLKANIRMQEPALLAFLCLAQRYEKPDEFLYQLTELKNYESATSGRIHIRSAEQARGREYERVFVLDCIGGIFPYPQKEEAEQKRERKLFLLAMTRAKEQLEFLSAKRCHTTRLEISPYLYEIYKAQPAKEEASVPVSPAVKPHKLLRPAMIKAGMRIEHKQLGEGKVMKVADGMMHVQFADGLKQMNIKLCIQNKLIKEAS